MAPLTDAVWLESIALGSGHQVFVSVPLGATEPRPVMVGMHGAGDRPEWACGGYRAATGAFPFIICPRGHAQDATAQKYDTPSSEWIEHDVEGALAVLRARFGRYVADGPLLFAGFSLGAAHGVAVVVNRPAMYPAALFIEGGYSQISPGFARRYSEGGGRRIMLGCGQANCPARFASAAASLRAAGIEVRILDGHTGRHNLDGEMMQALQGAWPWLIDGDPRWNAR